MTRDEAIAPVEHYLQQCARSGFFSSFSRQPDENGRALFRFTWHQEQRYEVFVDYYKRVIRMPLVLPNIEKGSVIDRNFREFVKQCHSDDLPEHRRIDRLKLVAKPILRGGNMTLSARVKDDDFGYGIDRLICLVHEVFKLFLKDGLYYQYLIDNFGLDPDTDF